VLDYDAEADRYDATRGGRARAEAAAAAVASLLPPGARRVCDVGAGTGIVSADVAARGVGVVCVDPSIGMLRHAATRLPGRCLQARGDWLPLRSASVDAVTFVWLLHLLPDAGPFLAEAARVLRPGGRVVTTVDKSGAHWAGNSDIAEALRPYLGPSRAADQHDRIVAQSAQHGLVPLGEVTFVGLGQGLTPRKAERWLGEQPGAADGLAALRALPDPDRARPDPVYRVLAVGRAATSQSHW
jgi:SAM-dependent methyltransferase